MIKAIVTLFITAIVLYAIFGVWGLIVPAVLIVALFVWIAVKSFGGDGGTSAATGSAEGQDEAGMQFDAVADVGIVRMAIEYKAADGNSTFREIDLHKIAVAHDVLYIRGFCHLRREERTFRVDRITSASVNDTPVDPFLYITELCQNSKEFGVFRNWFGEIAAKKILQRPGTVSSEGKLLSYIARQDGSLQKREKEMIADYLIRRHGLENIDREILINQIAAYYTTPNDFRSTAKSIVITEPLLDCAFTIAENDAMKKGSAEKLREYYERQNRGKGESASSLADQALRD